MNTIYSNFSLHSHVGGRDNNEDFGKAFSLNNFDVLIVCDGMGGHDDGDWASKTAVNILEKQLEKLDAQSNLRFDEVFLDRIDDAIQLANRTIYAQSQRSGGMIGTTLTMAITWKGPGPNYIWIGWCGDSKIYMLNNSTLEKIFISKDHNLQRAVSETDPHTHLERPDSLNRAIGVQPEVDYDYLIFELDEQGLYYVVDEETRDFVAELSSVLLLLCSDGLTSVFEKEVFSYEPEILDAEDERIFSKITTSIVQNASPEQVVDTLIDVALQRRTEDNITVGVLTLSLTEPVPVFASTSSFGGGFAPIAPETNTQDQFQDSWEWEDDYNDETVVEAKHPESQFSTTHASESYENDTQFTREEPIQDEFVQNQFPTNQNSHHPPSQHHYSNDHYDNHQFSYDEEDNVDNHQHSSIDQDMVTLSSTEREDEHSDDYNPSRRDLQLEASPDPYFSVSGSFEEESNNQINDHEQPFERNSEQYISDRHHTKNHNPPLQQNTTPDNKFDQHSHHTTHSTKDDHYEDNQQPQSIITPTFTRNILLGVAFFFIAMGVGSFTKANRAKESYYCLVGDSKAAVTKKLDDDYNQATKAAKKTGTQQKTATTPALAPAQKSKLEADLKQKEQELYDLQYTEIVENKRTWKTDPKRKNLSIEQDSLPWYTKGRCKKDFKKKMSSSKAEKKCASQLTALNNKLKPLKERKKQLDADIADIKKQLNPPTQPSAPKNTQNTNAAPPVKKTLNDWVGASCGKVPKTLEVDQNLAWEEVCEDYKDSSGNVSQKTCGYCVPFKSKDPGFFERMWNVDQNNCDVFLYKKLHVTSPGQLKTSNKKYITRPQYEGIGKSMIAFPSMNSLMQAQKKQTTPASSTPTKNNPTTNGANNQTLPGKHVSPEKKGGARGTSKGPSPGKPVDNGKHDGGPSGPPPGENGGPQK